MELLARFMSEVERKYRLSPMDTTTVQSGHVSPRLGRSAWGWEGVSG